MTEVDPPSPPTTRDAPSAAERPRNDPTESEYTRAESALLGAAMATIVIYLFAVLVSRDIPPTVAAAITTLCSGLSAMYLPVPTRRR